MSELKDFELQPTGRLLMWAFRIISENQWALNMAGGGGSGGARQSQLGRQLQVREAAMVVAAVDKLAPLQRDLLRYVYSGAADDSVSAEYNRLHNWVWSELMVGDERKECVTGAVSALRILLPLEMRARMLGHKKLYSAAALADFIGVSSPVFSRRYREFWEIGIDLFDALRVEAIGAMDDFLAGVLSRRSDAEVTAEIARYFRGLEKTQNYCLTVG